VGLQQHHGTCASRAKACVKIPGNYAGR
jgi:hypothetical protein